MPMWSSIYFTNSNSPSMEFLMFFHDLVMLLVMILITSLFFIYTLIFFMKSFSYNFPESQSLEDFWLLVPVMFLIFIGFPSIKNLYMCEEFNECDISLKVIGHQWYWSYEYVSLDSMFDCIMKKEDFYFRLLENFNHLILPIKSLIRFMVTSEDVIHSWTIPSMGIKLDSTPGRISQTISLINRPGMLIGQCSEICGTNHSFMPIVISANSINNFIL